MLIETPKRLHLGLIDPSASLGRRFGSLGLALQGGYRIRVMPHDKLEIKANEEDAKTIRFVIDKMNQEFLTGFNYLIDVENAIPRHVGLGSTTQLTLGVGLALAKLNNIRVEIENLASLLGRGKNSGAGIYTFKYGGFVMDSGVKGSIPQLIIREDLPEDWGFLLIIPHVKRGFDEQEEKPIMQNLAGRVEIAEKISHRILLGLLPALKERNIEEFGKHLTEIQMLVGKHFEGYQGGEFREDVKFMLEFLKENTYGYGQSSWGPTLYGLIKKDDYEVIKRKAQNFLKELGINAHVDIGVPRNNGATTVEENTYILRLINKVAKS